MRAGFFDELIHLAVFLHFGNGLVDLFQQLCIAFFDGDAGTGGIVCFGPNVPMEKNIYCYLEIFYLICLALLY